MENAKPRFATRTLIAGIIAPLAAAELGRYTYRALTQASTNRDSDWLFRLGVTAAVMSLPFVVTCVVAFLDKKRGRLGIRGYAGLALAVISLALIWVPVRGGMRRSKQAQLLSLEGVPAPPFETVDLDGKTHRLSDTEGKVVLINIWATWCPPCRKEMPELDKLYQDNRDRGLVVYGLSTEEVAVQKDFVENKLSVSYPLLTIQGEVPEIYRTTARYPANYLIDRKGRLTPAPSTDQPFENLAARVEELLSSESE